jgi:hypothetical protein
MGILILATFEEADFNRSSWLNGLSAHTSPEWPGFDSCFEHTFYSTVLFAPWKVWSRIIRNRNRKQKMRQKRERERERGRGRERKLAWIFLWQAFLP